MNVFISWSGERSRLVAELLGDWLKCVIQAVKPWLSSKDIDRGSLWFTQISEKLAQTSVGIVCITLENKDKPWILFESGALAKGLSSNRVCTFLIDLVPNDIEDPLAQFNHTLPDRDGVLKLLLTINRTLGDGALNDTVLHNVFDIFWPKFENEFRAILEKVPQVTPVVKRKEVDVLNDILSSIRNLERRQRDLEILQINKSNISSRDIRMEQINAALDLAKHYKNTKKHSQESIYELLLKTTTLTPNDVRMVIKDLWNSDDSSDIKP